MRDDTYRWGIFLLEFKSPPYIGCVFARLIAVSRELNTLMSHSLHDQLDAFAPSDGDSPCDDITAEIRESVEAMKLEILMEVQMMLDAVETRIMRKIAEMPKHTPKPIEIGDFELPEINLSNGIRDIATGPELTQQFWDFKPTPPPIQPVQGVPAFPTSPSFPEYPQTSFPLAPLVKSSSPTRQFDNPDAQVAALLNRIRVDVPASLESHPLMQKLHASDVETAKMREDGSIDDNHSDRTDRMMQRRFM